MRMSALSRQMPHMLSALRIVAALLFMTHGTVKLLGFPPGAPRPPLVLASQLGVAGLLEMFGGGLLLVGLFTRPVAFVLSGEMAVAYFTQHAPQSDWPIVNGGELAVLYCFIWLFYVAAGPGPWSVDALRKRA